MFLAVQVLTISHQKTIRANSLIVVFGINIQKIDYNRYILVTK